MNFIQNLLQRIEYGKYVPVATHGQIFSEKMGRDEFTLKTQLLKGKIDSVLRIDLNRRWGGTSTRTLADLHFQHINELSTPIRLLLHDVESGVTQPNVNPKTGLFESLIINAAAGKIVRAYGQIDNHPKQEERHKLELFLSWDGQRHWLLLCEGEGSVEWTTWSVGVAAALKRLFPKIEAQINKLDKLSHDTTARAGF